MSAARRSSLLTWSLWIALLVTAVVLFARWPTRTREIAARTHPEPGLVERGRYIALAADCSACHTANRGAPFAGGLALASPLGAIYSTNITPDPETGIGRYSLNDFDRAVRHGIGPGNVTLYPAMPYPSYSHMTDADIVALYAYFTHQVQPVRSQGHLNGIPWPLSMRWPLAIWRKLFAPDPDSVAFDASRYHDPAVARGAYLVEGPGHCGSCHTPRAFTLQERALDDSKEIYLSGNAVVEGWTAVSLRGDPAEGLGGWSREDIVSTLRSSHNAAHAVVGSPMNDVVVNSTQYLSDADLSAIAAYLKTLPASAHPASSFSADPATASALAAGRETNRGAQLYDDNCSACHHTDGKGATQVIPELAGNSSVLAADPTSIVRLILQGSRLPATPAAPSALGMPGFGWRLSDEEVAELGTFLRQSWGNHAAPITATTVHAVRLPLCCSSPRT
jgi:alcohol dehydrogenase (quinone), cytochrome c subunit